MLYKNGNLNARPVAKKFAIIALSGALIFSMSAPVATASNKLAFATPTSSSKQAEADNALQQLNSLQTKLMESANNYTQCIVDKEKAEEAKDEAQKNIDETNEKISDIQSQLSTRARSMYRTGSSSILDLIFGATSWAAFTQNWDILTSMNQKDGAMVNESKTLRENLKEQKKTYEEQEKIASDKATEAERTMNEAQELVNSQQAVYDQLSSEAAELLQQEQAAQETARQQAAAQAENAGNAGGSAGNGGGNAGGNSGGGSSVNNNKQQTVTGNTVVDRAYSCIGKPYVWGGVGPGGFDCSGLVSYCILGRNARLGTTGTFMGYTRVSNPQPGDIVTSSYHAGIYIGNGQMIHAPYPGTTVCVAPVMSDMIYVRY